MHTTLHVRCPIICIFLTDIRTVKFHETPTSRCRIVPSGRTDTTKPIVALRIVANVPKEKVCVNTARDGRENAECSQKVRDGIEGKRRKKKPTSI
jgi:hypothetical protein